MTTPSLNQQAITTLEQRVAGLDAIANDGAASAATRQSARDTRAPVAEELRIRREIEAAQDPAQKAQAERRLAEHRQRNSPASDTSARAACPPRVLRVHLHMRFLLPPALLRQMRDASVYPRRAANVPEPLFREWYSLVNQTIGRKVRWGGPHPVPNATVRLAGQTATTNAQGIATFNDVPAGTHRMEIVPPPNQATTEAAGPAIPPGAYVYASAPPLLFRGFEAQVVVSDQCWALDSTPTVTLTHQGNTPAYASIVDFTRSDLFLDWKPDWMKLPNREAATGRKRAIVLHQTATYTHEWIGSVINTFSVPNDEGILIAAHYIVDLDGHVLKIVHESEKTNHAGPSNWHEISALNTQAVGIENVHTDQNVRNGPILYREFTREQFVALNRLIGLLRAEFGIDKRYVCGHADCKRVNRDCPGDMFDWPSIEAPDHAPGPADGNASTDVRRVNPIELTSATSTHALSQQLHAIGYTNKRVEVAIERFIKRFWSGSRFPQRPAGTGIEAAPAQPARPAQNGRPAQAAVAAGRQVVQAVADAIGQMFRDL